MNKRLIVVLVLLVIIGVFGLNLISSPSEPEDTTLNETEQIDQAPVEPLVPEPDEPEEEDQVVVTCYEIPEPPEWGSDLSVIETINGESLLINPYVTLGVPESQETTWSQVSMDMTDTWYASHFELEIEPHENGTATVTPSETGVYRLQCETTSGEYLVDIRATEEYIHKWGIKGVIFGDVWGELGSPEFNIAPDDPDCRKKALTHAFTGPERVGANYVGFVPATFYNKVFPEPEFMTEGNFLSLTNETYYQDLVEAAHAVGLAVIHIEQSAPHWDLTQEDQEALETVWEDPEWVQAWFKAWTDYIMPRAEMAERNQVEIFVPYLYPDVDTFKAENYVEEWRIVIGKIRTVYSGEIGFNLINADERIGPLLEDIDMVLITVFPGLYISRLEDQYNPTADEITEITKGMFHAPKESIGDIVPVAYVLTVQSTDGQAGTEEVEWKLSMDDLDFEEQVIYYEGFFRALENETWVDGVISERWDFFDQYDRVGDSYEAAYFDMTREASPRSKPAEEVVKLWFNLR